ncbi:MAG: orotidine 5'-phosphate decarboxylase / HUMPS family protein [Desulfurococcaceae archaeon]
MNDISYSFPVLQVALDVEELVKAVDIATSIVTRTTCRNLWIEVGTPLLKAWGKIAIKALKNLTKCFVVADTKSIDVPMIEAKIVYSAGADAFTVLGISDIETIKEAVSAAREHGKKIIVDLIECREPYSRALEIARLEPDVILFHVGISVQKARGVSAEVLVEEAAKVKSELGVRVAVAGGLKPGRIRPLIEKGIDIVIVGSAITSSPDPASIATEILREIGISVEI